MRIDKFLNSLLPSFKKDNLREEISSVQTELNELTLPVYETAYITLAKVKFTSKETANFQKMWERVVKPAPAGNYIVGTRSVLLTMSENISTIERLIEKNFVNDVFKDAMSYLRANLIQYLELMGFVVKYARKLLHFTLYELTAEEDKKAGLVSNPLTKADMTYLVEKQLDFLQAINSMNVKKSDLESKFRNIPDVNATIDNVDTMEATVGKERLDPFKVGFIPTAVNPFFFFGKKIAEYQVSRYNVAVEEKKALELRLLNMKQIQEGKQDPKLQQAIEYSEDRLVKLNYRLREMEKEYLGE